MTTIFSNGDQAISSSTQEPISIVDFLGAGGQGEVYRATYCDKEYALKWYFSHTATSKQREGIEKLVQEGSPSNSFLWPSELAEASGKEGFGYLMPLREKRFSSFFDVVNGTLDPKFSILMTLGINLVDSYYRLHAKGLCYQDLSFGNGFFDPTTGEVRICDNDNVGTHNSPITTVLGTPDFMAPEVVIGKSLPNRYTDYFSQAVLLFYLFHIQHPLLGKKVLQIKAWDLPAREKLFGYEPVFIFDPKNKSNEAIDDPKRDGLGEAGKNALPYWNKIYPTSLKEAFITSFTTGINDPDQRLRGSQWKKVLNSSKNAIFTCSHCNSENFWDNKLPNRKCWQCEKLPNPRFYLELGDNLIVLSAGKQIFEYHANGEDPIPSAKPISDVVVHPKQPDVLGVRNKTDKNWTAHPAGKGMVEVAPGKSVPLCDGTKISIGNISGTIKEIHA